jgi:hypothetical protein
MQKGMLPPYACRESPHGGRKALFYGAFGALTRISIVPGNCQIKKGQRIGRAVRVAEFATNPIDQKSGVIAKLAQPRDLLITGLIGGFAFPVFAGGCYRRGRRAALDDGCRAFPESRIPGTAGKARSR